MLTIICALFLAVLFPAAMLVSKGLPADTGRYVAQKYAGWNGVLQAWVCCEWKPGGSFITWLNRRAAAFEKTHEGVYIEFTPVSRDMLRNLSGSGLRMPQIILFSPGVITDAALLAEIDMPSNLRSDLHISDRALPVAMGGYIRAVNRTLASDETPVLPPDEPGRNFSAAAIALTDAADEEAELIPVDPVLDLGLPVSAIEGPPLRSEDALEDFLDGKLPSTIITQSEIALLQRMSSAGNGVDWQCVISGSFAWADQLLLLGLTEGSEMESGALAAEFAMDLLDDESQGDLAGIGAFSVAGRAIHAPHSPYVQMDAMLNTLPLIAPDCFSEHSMENVEAIVRSVMRGEISARDGIANFTLETGLTQ